jgi:hypothetical protein
MWLSPARLIRALGAASCQATSSEGESNDIH